MTDRPTTAQIWVAGVFLLGAATYIGFLLPRGETAVRANSESVQSHPTPKPPNPSGFEPPAGDIPDTDFGKMAKLGEAIFRDTQANAKEFVGNSLQCENCHLGAGHRHRQWGRVVPRDLASPFVCEQSGPIAEAGAAGEGQAAGRPPAGDAIERDLGDGLVHDQLATGRKLRVLTFIDTFSRFPPALEPRFVPRRRRC